MFMSVYVGLKDGQQGKNPIEQGTRIGNKHALVVHLKNLEQGNVSNPVTTMTGCDIPM